MARIKYVMTHEKNFEDIATAIRVSQDTTDTYKPSEMADAILNDDLDIEMSMRISDLVPHLNNDADIILDERNYSAEEVQKTEALIVHFEELYNREEVQNV